MFHGERDAGLFLVAMEMVCVPCSDVDVNSNCQSLQYNYVADEDTEPREEGLKENMDWSNRPNAEMTQMV